ncbi:helix-turn-helix domain-containing protein [Acetivibrio cellulolyticus]|uniref:helix-turn-helix domain-containing protein n=1 Tax=Acetivibrio cellulolyticus TaxID=35830 RepID=UPI0001E2BA50|nr:helix-turn-helix transcriptional regulator [Acetivibrio cellulolyticus]
MDYKALGERIRKQRLKVNLTQEQLAEKIDMSYSFVGQIERGDRVLSLETLVRLANELSISVDYLIQDSLKFTPEVFISSALTNLQGKNEKKLKAFKDTIDILAENFDRLTNEVE